MELRKFGKTDMLVSPLGFGAAEIGFQEISERTVADLLGGALDAGLNVIDTAECYMGSEELIGRTVASRRKDFYLFSKVGHPDGYENPVWDRSGILKTIEEGLRRLRTDHLDLIQLHSCSEEILRRGEAIEALETARERGLARYLGYSGDGSAARFALDCGRFDALQTSVSIADQESLELLLPLAIEKGVGVIAKRPIANAVWLRPDRPDAEYYQPYWDRLQKLQLEVLQGDPAVSVSVALRFTVWAPGVTTAIVGTTRPDRWRLNATTVDEGPLPQETAKIIRDRWKKVADETWIGQV